MQLHNALKPDCTWMRELHSTCTFFIWITMIQMTANLSNMPARYHNALPWQKKYMLSVALFTIKNCLIELILNRMINKFKWKYIGILNFYCMVFFLKTVLSFTFLKVSGKTFYIYITQKKIMNLIVQLIFFYDLIL